MVLVLGRGEMCKVHGSRALYLEALQHHRSDCENLGVRLRWFLISLLSDDISRATCIEIDRPRLASPNQNSAAALNTA